jgi:chitinase
MAELNQYQLKQKDFIEGLDKKIKQFGYDPMNITMECRTCNVKENFGNKDSIIEFLNQHAGHFTWSTNNNFKGGNNGYRRS